MKGQYTFPTYYVDPNEQLYNEYNPSKDKKYKKAAKYDKFNRKIASDDDLPTYGLPIMAGSPIINEPAQDSNKIEVVPRGVAAMSEVKADSEESYFFGDIAKED